MENQIDSISSHNGVSTKLVGSKISGSTQAGVFKSQIQYSKDKACDSKVNEKKTDGFIPKTKHVSLVDLSKQNAESVDGQSVPHHNPMICPHCQSPFYGDLIAKNGEHPEFYDDLKAKNDEHPDMAGLSALLYKGRKEDLDEPEFATRGDWWKGSYHY